MRYLLVDGMMSGTGIRDAVEGGYLDPKDLELSEPLVRRISLWLLAYEEAHLEQYSDKDNIAELDAEGRKIRDQVREELPDAKVRYYSDAEARILE